MKKLEAILTVIISLVLGFIGLTIGDYILSGPICGFVGLMLPSIFLIGDMHSKTKQKIT